MSKPLSSPFAPHRYNWTNGAARSLRQDYQQTEQSDAQDSTDSVSDKREADSKQDKSYYEGPVKFKNGDCPVKVFEITLALIEEMTNEAAE